MIVTDTTTNASPSTSTPNWSASSDTCSTTIVGVGSGVGVGVDVCGGGSDGVSDGVGVGVEAGGSDGVSLGVGVGDGVSDACGSAFHRDSGTTEPEPNPLTDAHADADESTPAEQTAKASSVTSAQRRQREVVTRGHHCPTGSGPASSQRRTP